MPLCGNDYKETSQMKKAYLMMAILGVFFFSVARSPVQAQDTPGSGQDRLQHQTTGDDAGFDDFFDDDPFEDAQTGPGTDPVADPFYYFNYAMYVVNDNLYFYFLKPVANGYKAVMPTPARKGIRNFFHNLLFPVRFVNNLLQWKLEQASDEFGIFLVNSTAGILGFNQVAQKHLNMNTNKEDLGQTLGTYGMHEGFYLVLPVLGPATFRDAVGRAGDYFITPVNYVEPWELAWGLDILDAVNRISFHIGDYETLKKAALDPYAAIRDAYIQSRRQQIRN
jgi:phospholipid-binding lipoprotein MlaA